MENQVIHGDCIEEMQKLDAQSIDVIITSPPYNLITKHHIATKRFKTYNDRMPEKEYQEWQLKVLEECYRVLKDTGSLIYNHKNRIKDHVQITPYQWILKSPFIVKQEIVWFNRSQNFDKMRFYPMTERLYWLAKSPKTRLINVINHHDLFLRSEWTPVGIKGQHNRSFPEKMVEDMLSCFPDAINVLDPFAGSGTVGVVAKRLNRNFILIEKEEEYYNLINERLV